MSEDDIVSILQDYNNWDNTPQELGYIRTVYLQQLESYFNNNLIKVLIGQRRAGKSYILKQLIALLVNEKQVNCKNILYLNFEIEKLSFISDYHILGNVIDLYKAKLQPQGKFYCFFDEIQEVPGWEKIVTSLVADPHHDVEIILTGSNSNLLSSELATYLSGRYVTKNIFPFDYVEYCGYYQKNSDKQSFLDYLQFSGIPELYHLPNQELQLSFVQDLKNTILLKDIVQRYNVQQADLLEKIFLFLTDNIGNLFSLNALVKKLKNIGISSNTVTLGNYLQYIENTFLLSGVSRYDVRGKRILDGEKKYYLNDLAFRNFLSSSFDIGMGKLLENYVYNYLKVQGYSIYVGNTGTQEIDFIAEKKDQKIYIQVAYLLIDEQVVEREYGVLEAVKDNWEKIVISMDDIQLSPKNGIRHVRAWELDNFFDSLL